MQRIRRPKPSRRVHPKLRHRSWRQPEQPQVARQTVLVCVDFLSVISPWLVLVLQLFCEAVQLAHHLRIEVRGRRFHRRHLMLQQLARLQIGLLVGLRHQRRCHLHRLEKPRESF